MAILKIFIFLFCTYFITAKHHLAHLHVLFRHGDRSSIKPFVFDGYNPYEVWRDGLGQLTQEGIEQHFLLGEWLKNAYSNFIKPSYNVTTFHMRSSDVDRSLMSAQALMAGFFHHSNSSLDKYGLHWRPIPAHTVPTTEDTLLSIAPCPRLAQRRKELLESKDGEELFKQHEKTIELVGEFYGIKNMTLMDLWLISDDLYCLSCHNATLPKWYTDDIAKELNLIMDKVFQLLYTDQETLKLAVGVFLKDTFDRMEEYIHASPSNSSRLESLLAYSAHDTNVAPLLGALGAYSNESKPQYASLVAIEFLAPPANASHSDEYLLRLHYKRGWRDEKGSYIQFGACRNREAKGGCDFAAVRKSVTELLLTPGEIKGACKANWLPVKYRLIVIIAVSAFLGLLVVTFGSVYCVVWKNRDQQEINFKPSGQLAYSLLASSAPTA